MNGVTTLTVEETQGTEKTSFIKCVKASPCR